MLYSNVVWLLVFLLVVGGWASSEIVVQAKNRRPTGVKRDGGTMLFSLLIGLSGAVLSFLFPLLPVTNMTNILWQPGTFLIGLVIALFGIALRWAAILTLGAYFTGAVIIQADHVLIQHGPYRWVRHPSYTGAFLLAIGMGLMIGNWISLFVIVLGLFFSLLRRIPVEEQALQEIPGYADYMRRTRRMIPFLF